MAIRADEILYALEIKHTRRKKPDAFFTQVKNGPTQLVSSGLLIMDALAIRKSWTRPCFIGYEVKVDRNDFVRDTKWQGYLDYCHQFYFVSPPDVVRPDDLPEKVGLMHYNEDKQTLTTKRKAIMNPIDISAEMLYYIIISRLENDRHPFFSTERDVFEAYVQDKENRKSLGYKVSSKMARELSETEEERQSLERRNKRLEENNEKLQNILKILEPWGVRPFFAEEDVEAMVNNGVSPKLLRRVENLVNEALRIKGMLEAPAQDKEEG